MDAKPTVTCPVASHMSGPRRTCADSRKSCNVTLVVGDADPAVLMTAPEGGARTRREPYFRRRLDPEGNDEPDLREGRSRAPAARWPSNEDRGRRPRHDHGLGGLRGRPGEPLPAAGLL